MLNDEFVNIAKYLPIMASEKPYAPAVIVSHGCDRWGRASYTHYTLKQLNECSDVIAHGLEKSGIVRGMHTALMVKPGLNFFALTFALFKVGAVPVMVDPGIGIKNLGQCLSQARPRAFIGISKAQIARKILGWARGSIEISITVGTSLGLTLSKLLAAAPIGKAYQMAKTGANDIAAILFTSGSTGVSKGAIYTHGIFDAQVRFLRAIYGIEPGEIDLATFPLFALFGPALGMAAIIPDMDASRPAAADPHKIFSAIYDFAPTNMFVSPALLDKLGRYGEQHGLEITSLKRVISAGAPANPESLARFSRMLPDNVQIFTPYGATESLPVCSIGSDEILGETGALTRQGKGVCVGLPVPKIELKIIDISDEPIAVWSDNLVLAHGKIGEIVVKGPVVTRKYYNLPQATAAATIVDPKGGFYHRMGDIGYQDDKGRVWFCGRKSHRVLAESTLFTIPCEAIFNTHPEVFRTALVGVLQNNVIRPVLCVELEKNVVKSREIITRELLDIGGKYEHTASIKDVLFHPAFPVDIRHNAKIFREKLAVWARRKL